MTPARILIVEDDRIVARDIQQRLTRIGYTVVGITGRGEDAVGQVIELTPDLVLMDIGLDGDTDDVATATRIRDLGQVPVVYLTANADDRTLARARLAEPFGYVLKPFEDSQLRTAIEIALYKHGAERKLLESERRYAVTLSSIGDGVIVTDDASRVIFMNGAAEKLTGFSSAEAGGRPLDEVFQVRPENAPALARGQETNVSALGRRTTWILSRHGHDVLIDGSVAPIVDDRGKAMGQVVVFRDIAELREAAEASSRIELALRGTDTGVWDIPLSGGAFMQRPFYQFNTCQPLGFDEGSMPTGAARMALWHPDDVERIRRWQDDYQTGKEKRSSIEVRIRHRDGAYRWLLHRGQVVCDAQGVPTRFVGLTVDITYLKELEQKLQHAKQIAETANRAKDEFLANVSHEIRTPMNAILGMTELVLDTPLSQGQRQSLKTVQSAAGSLLGTINDLLDFSKIEAGKLELDPEPFLLRATLGDVMRALAVRAHRKGLELVCDIHSDVPDAVIGDVARLRQILLNLVGNAIKFTLQGEVVVRVDVATGALDAARVNLRFIVRDTGVGIPLEKQETIFRAFEQEDTSTTRKYGGTGLGLTIASRLVTLMGGQITVESEPRRGSAFTFDVWLERQAHPVEAATIPLLIYLRNMRVLIVDDNAVNRHILEEWLRNWGMDPTSVGDGVAAMDALWHGASSRRPYALLIIDARMPDTDGLSLTAKIRERPELAGSRIILLTSGDRAADLARIRELRINAHLLKPVPQDELLETIHVVMGQPEGASPSHTRPGTDVEEPHPATFEKPLRVLVAEDNEFNAQLMEQLLTRRGHLVRLTTTGQEALKLLDEESFDLLLLDIHMPLLDGFQVTAAIRARERKTGAHLPIIAVTARSRTEDRDVCLAAGMDEFVVKPVLAADLWAAVTRVTGAAGGPDWLDARVLLTASGEDATTLRSMCEALRDRLPEELAALEDAVHDHDWALLHAVAHKIRRALAPFSPLAVDIASRIQTAATRNDSQEVASLAEKLGAVARQLRQQVRWVSLDALRREAASGGVALPPNA
ncbi:MAG: response regulator [Polyangiaceae bacterium]